MSKGNVISSWLGVSDMEVSDMGRVGPVKLWCAGRAKDRRREVMWVVDTGVSDMLVYGVQEEHKKSVA